MLEGSSAFYNEETQRIQSPNIRASLYQDSFVGDTPCITDIEGVNYTGIGDRKENIDAIRISNTLAVVAVTGNYQISIPPENYIATYYGSSLYGEEVTSVAQWGSSYRSLNTERSFSLENDSNNLTVWSYRTISGASNMYLSKEDFTLPSLTLTGHTYVGLTTLRASAENLCSIGNSTLYAEYRSYSYGASTHHRALTRLEFRGSTVVETSIGAYTRISNAHNQVDSCFSAIRKGDVDYIFSSFGNEQEGFYIKRLKVIDDKAFNLGTIPEAVNFKQAISFSHVRQGSSLYYMAMLVKEFKQYSEVPFWGAIFGYDPRDTDDDNTAEYLFLLTSSDLEEWSTPYFVSSLNLAGNSGLNLKSIYANVALAVGSTNNHDVLHLVTKIHTTTDQSKFRGVIYNINTYGNTPQLISDDIINYSNTGGDRISLSMGNYA